MKKVFEIYIDDDAYVSGICGTIISKRPNDETRVGMGVTSFNLSEKEFIGKAGYYFPISGNGYWIMKEDTTDDESYKGPVSKEEFNAAVKELKESVDRSILEWLSKKEEKEL